MELYYDAHKIEHMYHDNSILAYEMNGKPPSCMELRCAFAMNSSSGFKQVSGCRQSSSLRPLNYLGRGKADLTKTNESFGYRAPI